MFTLCGAGPADTRRQRIQMRTAMASNSDFNQRIPTPSTSSRHLSKCRARMFHRYSSVMRSDSSFQQRRSGAHTLKRSALNKSSFPPLLHPSHLSSCPHIPLTLAQISSLASNVLIAIALPTTHASTLIHPTASPGINRSAVCIIRSFTSCVHFA